MTSNHLIVSADDYAANSAIDDGIVALIDAGRISAASCMTCSSRWALSARRLTAAVRERCDLGLHLDFTQFSVQPVRKLSTLVVLAQLRRLNPAQTKGAIGEQIDRFEQALGSPPDYIDGHQHVHQLPQIRDALLEVLSTRYSAARRPWLRVSHVVRAGIKGFIIHHLGADALQKGAAARGFQTTARLLGIYGFDLNDGAYVRRLEGWLGEVRGISALMCHPAAHLDLSDPIGAARCVEFKVLGGDRFATALEWHGLQPERGSRIFACGD